MHAHHTEDHACCAPQAQPLKSTPPAHHGDHADASLARLTTAATLHCLTGCAVGELIGLAIGISLGLTPWATTALATAMGFASGFALGLRPLLQQGMSFGAALRSIWLGELVSITVMELAMNFVDYHAGGMRAGSMLSTQFWLAYALALPAGFLAAWPANYLLLRKNIKQPCHHPLG